jgi:polyisoprenoid-binding protein YceI
MDTPHLTDATGAAPAAPFSSAAIWRVDPDESVARFAAATLWGRVPVTGQLGRLTGMLRWDPPGGRGRLTVAVGGISSAVRLRDHHLRSGAFFDVGNHPEVTFEAADVLAADGHLRLSGELLVRGRRHALECAAAVEALDEDSVALETAAPFDLRQLGMSSGLLRMIPPGVSTEVRVILRRETA